jgi:hypothetical protein
MPKAALSLLAMCLAVPSLALGEEPIRPAWVMEHLSDAPMPTKEPCPTLPEYAGADFRVETGHFRSANRVKAIEKARQDAANKVRDKVCTGRERSDRCLAALRNVRPYGVGAWNTGDHGACASVMAPSRFYENATDLEDFHASLAALGRRVAADLGGRPLRLATPVWASSTCTAGEIAPHLLTALQQGLESVILVDEPVEDAVTLRLELAAGPQKVLVAASIREPGAVGWRPLKLQDGAFPASLFALGREEKGNCSEGSSLGLPSGQQASPSGLSVRIDAGGAGGVLCAGERLAPRVLLSGKARLRIYSLDPDGSGYQVWPMRAEDDRAYGPGDPPSLPRFVAVENHPQGDSRLVAVALPPGKDKVLFKPGYCRLPGPFQAASMGGAATDAAIDAAIDSVTFQVLAAGERVCEGRGVIEGKIEGEIEGEQDRVEKKMSEAPVCTR